MQDRDTGEMKRITKDEAHKIQEEEARSGKKPPTCIIKRGEIVAVNHGVFRVVAIGRKYIRLEGLPGTIVKEA